MECGSKLQSWVESTHKSKLSDGLQLSSYHFKTVAC